MTTTRALFSCSHTYCAQEVSYPASDLCWYEPERRFVCENCWENLPRGEDGELPKRGKTLEERLLRHSPPLEELL